jgi:cell shape-determining protein MreC
LETEARARLEAKDEQIEELESKLGCRMAQIENMEEMFEELKRENAELKKMFWSPPASNENMKVRSEMYNLVG